MIRRRENSAQNWIAVYRHRTTQAPVTSTKVFSFQPQPARYLRIDFAASRDGDHIRIDELEIYSTHVKKWYAGQQEYRKVLLTEHRCEVAEIDPRRLRAPIALSSSRPVDHERDCSITRLYDHDLIAGDEEHIASQYRHAIEHKRRELVQLDVLRDLGTQREP